MASSILRKTSRSRAAGSLWLLLVAASGPATAQGGALFPEPFVIEHRLVQSGDDGGRFEGDPVTDYYGGSWIVSVRADEGRTVIDLARREVTEIDPARGTYSTIGFDRLAELTERAGRAQKRAREPEPEDDPGIARRSAKASPPELVVEELPSAEGLATRAGGTAARANAPGVLRLRVVTEDRVTDPDAGLEVWLDSSVRLRPVALDALASFERALSGGAGADEGDGVGRHVAAARAHAGGAVPVRTVRAVGKEGRPRIRVEDVVSRLETLADFPEELVAVPEGLRRVPHPLEGMVAFLEAEAERERAMAGVPEVQP